MLQHRFFSLSFLFANLSIVLVLNPIHCEQIGNGHTKYTQTIKSTKFEYRNSQDIEYLLDSHSSRCGVQVSKVSCCYFCCCCLIQFLFNRKLVRRDHQNHQIIGVVSRPINIYIYITSKITANTTWDFSIGTRASVEFRFI